MSIGLDPSRDVPGDTIDQYKASLGDYLGAVASDSWATGPFMSTVRLGLTSAYQQEAEARGESLLTPDEANSQGKALGLRFNQPIAQGAYNVIAQERQRQINDEQTFKRARNENGYGTLSWLLGGGTEFLMQAVDPLNVAASFVPVVPEARFAMMAKGIGTGLATVARGAIEGAAGQAILEPIAALERRQMGEEYHLLDTVLDLTFGAGLGVILHGVHYGSGAGFRFIRDKYILAEPQRPPSLLKEPLDASAREPIAPPIADGARAPTEPVVVERSTPPPRQPVSEAMEGLNEGTKQTALRVEIAQLAQDKPPDVEPVLNNDPAWPQIKASIEAHTQLQSQAAAEATPARWTVPADWTPSAPQLAEARRLVQGLDPQKALAEPVSLAEFVARAGGLKKGTPEAGDLAALEVGTRLERRLVQEGGRDVAHLAQAAFEEGYPVPRDERVGSGVDVQGFMEALSADASGRIRMYADDAATADFQAQQDYFRNVAEWLRELGVDPREMEPRRLAYLLAQDPDHAHMMALVDRLSRVDEHTSMELADRIDREVAREELGLTDARDIEREHRGADLTDVSDAAMQELERYYEQQRRALGEDTGGGQSLEPIDPFGRPAQDREAQAPRPGEGQHAPAEAGLRPEAGAEGAQAARQGADADLASFAERQAGADLHADPDALSRQDERLIGEERELKAQLDDLLKVYEPILNDADRAGIAAIDNAATDAERAMSALATCKMGGA